MKFSPKTPYLAGCALFIAAFFVMICTGLFTSGSRLFSRIHSEQEHTLRPIHSFFKLIDDPKTIHDTLLAQPNPHASPTLLRTHIIAHPSLKQPHTFHSVKRHKNTTHVSFHTRTTPPQTISFKLVKQRDTWTIHSFSVPEKQDFFERFAQQHRTLYTDRKHHQTSWLLTHPNIRPTEATQPPQHSNPTHTTTTHFSRKDHTATLSQHDSTHSYTYSFTQDDHSLWLISSFSYTHHTPPASDTSKPSLNQPLRITPPTVHTPRTHTP